jgi:hypothetical protein
MMVLFYDAILLPPWRVGKEKKAELWKKGVEL